MINSIVLCAFVLLNLPSENVVFLSVAGLSRLVKNTREFLLSSVYSLPTENVFFVSGNMWLPIERSIPCSIEIDVAVFLENLDYFLNIFSVIATSSASLHLFRQENTGRKIDRHNSQEQGTNNIKKVLKRQTIPLQGSQIHNAQWKEKSFFGLTAHGVQLDNHCQNHL